MTGLLRRGFIVALSAAAAICAILALVLAAAGPAAAQVSYPDRPVRLIVGFTAGSATDITARMFAQKFSEAWGIPVTVENIPGAGGAVVLDRVAKAAPDGHTLAWAATGALTIGPSLQSKSSYDPVRDLAPISQVLTMPSILAVNNDVPVKTFEELIALARAQPGKLSYATPGVGTPQHVAGELLKSLAGVDIVHVPYQSLIAAKSTARSTAQRAGVRAVSGRASAAETAVDHAPGRAGGGWRGFRRPGPV